MKYILFFIICSISANIAGAQKLTIQQMKIELEKSPNSALYTKDILKKKFRLDTISITRIGSYQSLADSLAYAGKIRKVYGPYGKPNERFLVQVLGKAPNTFYRVSQIFIDTSVFRLRFADSLGNLIMNKLKTGADSFEHLSQTYSMGGESATKGDLGWVARGVFMPEIERAVEKGKKGEVFKIWTRNGLHIIRKTENPKQDTGFALMMRVLL